MQGQGKGVTQGIGVDVGGSSGGDDIKSFAGRGRSVYGYGMNPLSVAMPENYGYGYGYGYGAWTFGMPLLPLPPLLHNMSHGRGTAPRPLTSLGVQKGGILKRNPQSGFVHGRGHARGNGSGRSTGGGRGGKNLTKEALDADLDEWRLKDKRFAGQSLDAELDDYWSKKDTLDSEAG
eukprot:c18552_g1_i2 orf=513-1043(+)